MTPVTFRRTFKRPSRSATPPIHRPLKRPNRSFRIFGTFPTNQREFVIGKREFREGVYVRPFCSWVYHTEEALEGTPHWGQLTTYSGAGYYQNLHYLKDDSVEIIRELKEGLWITQGTRFVTIDFTVYNVNINLFCVAK